MARYFELKIYVRLSSQKLFIYFFLIFFLWSNFTLSGQVVQLQSGHTAATVSVNFLNNGTQFISTGLDNQVIIWDINSGKEISRWHDFDLPAYDLCIDKMNGLTVIPVGKSICILNPKTKTKRIISGGHLINIRSVKLNYDGSYLGSLDYTGKIVIRNTKDFKIEDSLLPKDGVSCFTFLPGSHDIAYCSATHSNVYNFSYKLERSLSAISINAISMAVSPDGNYLVIAGASSASGKSIAVIDVRTGKYDTIKDAVDKILRIDFSPDKNEFLTCGENGSIIIWDLLKKEKKITLQQNDIYPVLDARYNKDGRYIISCNNNDKIIMWDAVWGTNIKNFEGYSAESGINSVTTNNDGTLLYTASDDNIIRVWNIAAQKMVSNIPSLHEFNAAHLEFSKKGDFFTSTGSDKVVLLNSQNEIIHSYKNSHPIYYSSISENGKSIVYSSLDSIIIIPKINEVRKETLLVPDMYFAQQVKFLSQKKNIIVACGDNTVRLYNVSAKTNRILLKHNNPVECVSVSPTERYLVSGSREDGVIKIYDFKTATVVTKKGHEGTVYNLKFIDNNLFISCGEDGKLKKWDVQTATVRKEFIGHKNRVNDFCFTPDKSKMISAGFDGTVKIWDLKVNKLLTTIVPIGNDTMNYISFTPENYYLATRKGIKAVNFLTKDKVCSFDQFDLYYNRPDKVLETIGLAGKEKIEQLNRVYNKRLRYYGFEPDSLDKSPVEAIPELAIETNSQFITKEPELLLSIVAGDKQYQLKKINVYINGVPLFGSKGRSIQAPAKMVLDEVLTIQLSRGLNVIEVSVLNEKGIESIRNTRVIYYKKDL